MQNDVQIAPGVGRDGLPKLGHQLAVEIADLRRGKLDVPGEMGPPAQSTAQVASDSSIGKVKKP